MTSFSRGLLRLRQRAVKFYELLLYALLLSLALAVGLASTSVAEEAQCGNIHSSPSVITR